MNALTTKHRCLGGEVQPWRQSLLATIASQFHWTECRWSFTTRPPQHVCRPHSYASTDRVVFHGSSGSDCHRTEISGLRCTAQTLLHYLPRWRFESSNDTRGYYVQRADYCRKHRLAARSVCFGGDDCREFDTRRRLATR